jgi:hypothetical protein
MFGYFNKRHSTTSSLFCLNSNTFELSTILEWNIISRLLGCLRHRNCFEVHSKPLSQHFLSFLLFYVRTFSKFWGLSGCIRYWTRTLVWALRRTWKGWNKYKYMLIHNRNYRTVYCSNKNNKTILRLFQQFKFWDYCRHDFAVNNEHRMGNLCNLQCNDTKQRSIRGIRTVITVTTTRCVLGLRMEEHSPDTEVKIK